MKTRAVRCAGFIICCLALAFPVLAQQGAKDPLSGTWAGDWGPTATHRNMVSLELKWDGKTLTGTVNPGPNAVRLKKATFNAATGAVQMEADAKGENGRQVHYVIEGKVAGGVMTGSWNHDSMKGDFKVTKK